MTILIPVVGLLSTTLVLFLWYPKQIKTGRLSALYTVDSARTLSSLDYKSLVYILISLRSEYQTRYLPPTAYRCWCLWHGHCLVVPPPSSGNSHWGNPKLHSWSMVG